MKRTFDDSLVLYHKNREDLLKSTSHPKKLVSVGTGCGYAMGDKTTSSCLFSCSGCMEFSRWIDLHSKSFEIKDRETFICKHGKNDGIQFEIIRHPHFFPPNVSPDNFYRSIYRWLGYGEYTLLSTTPFLRDVMINWKLSSLMYKYNIPTIKTIHLASICNDYGYTLMEETIPIHVKKSSEVKCILIQLMMTLKIISKHHFIWGHTQISMIDRTVEIDTNKGSKKCHPQIQLHGFDHSGIKINDQEIVTSQSGGREFHYFPSVEDDDDDNYFIVRRNMSDKNFVRYFGIEKYQDAWNAYAALLVLNQNTSFRTALLENEKLAKLWNKIWDDNIPDPNAGLEVLINRTLRKDVINYVLKKLV